MKPELLEISNKIINAVMEGNKRFVEKSKAQGKVIVISKNGLIQEIDYSKK